MEYPLKTFGFVMAAILGIALGSALVEQLFDLISRI